MTILFDLSSTQPLSGIDFHGGGEYAKTVFYALCNSLPSDVSIEIFYNPLKNIENAILETCTERKITIHPCRNNANISALLSSKKYHAFFSALPYLYYDLAIPPETRFVYTIHGLRPLEYPSDKYELKYVQTGSLPEIARKLIKHFFCLFFPSVWHMFKREKYVRNFNKLFSLTTNQTIITVSNHSKYAIARFFPQINRSCITVLYSPMKKYEPAADNESIVHSLSLKPGKYILLISGGRSEKGAYRACRVLHTLIQNRGGIPDDIKIVVLGVSHAKPYRKLTQNSSRFVFHDYVPAEDLEILYKNAGLFVFPSMNEGFGYPPLEAMKYGTVCACSANSSLTEIYGDSVLYFNPYDEIEMSIRILQGFDEGIRAEKREKMPDRYQLIREKQEQDLNLLVRMLNEYTIS
jgi:glycosyltransferase involved in cell wall biosynthesis